jgi:hypothetical protein
MSATLLHTDGLRPALGPSQHSNAQVRPLSFSLQLSVLAEKTLRMSTDRAARYRRLALQEPDEEKARLLHLLAEEAERGTLWTVDRLSFSTVEKNSSDKPPAKRDSKWYIGS